MGKEIYENYEGKEYLLDSVKTCFVFKGQCGSSLDARIKEYSEDAVDQFLLVREENNRIAEANSIAERQNQLNKLLVSSHNIGSRELQYIPTDEALIKLAEECLGDDQQKSEELKLKKEQVVSDINDSFDSGVNTLRNGDLKTALKEFTYSANQGHHQGMVMSGLFYLNGWGVPQDLGKAQEYFELAVKQNSRAGQYYLGKMYLAMQIKPQYGHEGGELLTKSANQGYARAQYDLAKLLLEKGSYDDGMQMFTLAAEQGYVEAQVDLAWKYYEGSVRGGADNKEAFKWFMLAAEQNSMEAQVVLGDMHKNGEGIPQDYAKAFEFYSKAAEKSPYANYMLGLMFENGEGRPKDINTAKQYLTKASEMGSAKAKQHLASIDSNKKKSVDKLLTVQIYGKNRLIEDKEMRNLAIKCADGGQDACSALENKKPDAVANLSEVLKTMVDCNIKYLTNTSYGDFYTTYENEDWANKDDGDYDFLINLEWTVTYNGTSSESIRQGNEGNYAKDYSGRMNKDQIVRFKKMGKKFVPAFSNHWSVIEILDYPEISKAFLLGEVGGYDYLSSKTTCKIEKVSKR